MNVLYGLFIGIALVLIFKAAIKRDLFWYGLLTVVIIDSLLYRIGGPQSHWLATRHDFGFVSNKVCIVLGIAGLLYIGIRMNIKKGKK